MGGRSNTRQAAREGKTVDGKSLTTASARGYPTCFLREFLLATATSAAAAPYNSLLQKFRVAALRPSLLRPEAASKRPRTSPLLHLFPKHLTATSAKPHGVIY